MKKIFILLLSGSFLFSCTNTATDEKTIKKQISDYKKEVKEINAKISDLEQELANMTGVQAKHSAKTAVKVVEVNKKPFAHFFESTGEIESVNAAYISPEVGGQITKINVVEGQKVRKGQLLAKLNTTVIEQNITEVKTRLDLAEVFYNKQKELWDKKIGSERQYLEAKNNFESLQNSLNTLRAQYNMSVIHSPIGGYVEQIVLKEGELASPGFQLMQIVSLNKLYVTTKLSESYLSAIKVGDTIEIQFPSYPDMLLKRPVTRISNVVNKQNRTFDVEVAIDNPDNLLKPNLLATMRINDYFSPASIVLPSILIKEDMKGNYLFTAEKKNEEWHVKKSYVSVGVSFKNETEVLSGIVDGEYVITDGYSNVSEGMFVNVKQ